MVRTATMIFGKRLQTIRSETHPRTKFGRGPEFLRQHFRQQSATIQPTPPKTRRRPVEDQWPAMMAETICVTVFVVGQSAAHRPSIIKSLVQPTHASASVDRALATWNTASGQVKIRSDFGNQSIGLA